LPEKIRKQRLSDVALSATVTESAVYALLGQTPAV
jgi:hypothetical protein